jgi:hypothetical protein
VTWGPGIHTIGALANHWEASDAAMRVLAVCHVRANRLFVFRLETYKRVHVPLIPHFDWIVKPEADDTMMAVKAVLTKTFIFQRCVCCLDTVSASDFWLVGMVVRDCSRKIRLRESGKGPVRYIDCAGAEVQLKTLQRTYAQAYIHLGCNPPNDSTPEWRSYMAVGNATRLSLPLPLFWNTRQISSPQTSWKEPRLSDVDFSCLLKILISLSRLKLSGSFRKDPQ